MLFDTQHWSMGLSSRIDCPKFKDLTCLGLMLHINAPLSERLQPISLSLDIANKSNKSDYLYNLLVWNCIAAYIAAPKIRIMCALDAAMSRVTVTTSSYLETVAPWSMFRFFLGPFHLQIDIISFVYFYYLRNAKKDRIIFVSTYVIK